MKEKNPNMEDYNYKLQILCSSNSALKKEGGSGISYVSKKMIKVKGNDLKAVHYFPSYSRIVSLGIQEYIKQLMTDAKVLLLHLFIMA